MADENKSFLGLLNGISRKEYYGEDEFTDEYLKEQLYKSMSHNDFTVLTLKARGLIKSMATADMDLAQLGAFLTSQQRKREGAITEDQGKVYAKFWKNHRGRIHDALVARTQWNRNLKNLSWRIDMKTQSREHVNLSSPTAILELQLADPLHREKELDAVTFEMDENNLSSLLSNLKEIEAQLQTYSS